MRRVWCTATSRLRTRRSRARRSRAKRVAAIGPSGDRERGAAGRSGSPPSELAAIAKCYAAPGLSASSSSLSWWRSFSGWW
ncbi:hypothetical protein CKJ61_14315 [Mycobacterium intracellulare]|nr:hypothetical protein CKJ61_14315 [Mycobacterium intracellulare]